MCNTFSLIKKKITLHKYNNIEVATLKIRLVIFRYMWYETNLRATSSIEDTGEIVPAIIGCWLVGWVLTYVCLFKVY